MTETFTVLALGGDGIGPEVTDAGLKVLGAAAAIAGISVNVEQDLLHGAAWDRYGTFCREETLTSAKNADAVLVGAVGGPEWDGIRVSGGPEMQDGLMRLRFELGAYLGVRPARAEAALSDLSPYRSDVVLGADIVVLREMCGGAFFGSPRGIEAGPDGRRRGTDTTVYSEDEIARFARAGFALAKRRKRFVASADKANVMESSKLWRDVVTEVSAEFPDITLQHFYADNLAYQLARRPTDFDVILSDNLFGDILSDQAGAIAGSLGMLPSACLAGAPRHQQRQTGIYEAVHGSAPDIAGEGIANPIGTILSVAMMFDYSIGRPDICERIKGAVVSALALGHRTVDLGGTATTAAMTDAIVRELQA